MYTIGTAGICNTESQFMGHQSPISQQNKHEKVNNDYIVTNILFNLHLKCRSRHLFTDVDDHVLLRFKYHNPT